MSGRARGRPTPPLDGAGRTATSKLSAGLTLLVLTACADAQPLSELAPVEPFDRMADVRLGMRAGELLRVSPDLEPADYVGYREDADGYRVWYEIPGSMSEGQAPSPSRRLEAVRVETVHRDSTDAAAAWTAQLSKVTDALGPPHTCLAASDRRLRSRAAIWELSPPVVLSLADFERLAPTEARRVELRVGELHPYFAGVQGDGTLPCGEIGGSASMG